jgi:hypothetical protein
MGDYINIRNNNTESGLWVLAQFLVLILNHGTEDIAVLVFFVPLIYDLQQQKGSQIYIQINVQLSGL